MYIHVFPPRVYAYVGWLERLLAPRARGQSWRRSRVSELVMGTLTSEVESKLNSMVLRWGEDERMRVDRIERTGRMRMAGIITVMCSCVDSDL